LYFPIQLIEIIQTSLFSQLAFILISAGVLGFIALKLHQPLIVAFIAIGVLMSPSALDILGENSAASIDTLAALGITLLLFMVGLKLDLKLIRTMGGTAMVTGLAQVILTIEFGFIIAMELGYELIPSIVIGIALSFSSTIFVVKLLSDQRAIDSLHGKISIGVLIIQDIIVIITMVAMAGFNAENGMTLSVDTFAVLLAKALMLIAFTGIFIRYLADPLTHTLSKSPELTVIFAIGLAATMAGISHYIGLSKELGGLLAGVALASTAMREDLVSRLSPVRDFLLIFFFVNMGSHLNLSTIGDQVPAAMMLSVFVLLAKPLIIMGLTISLGYRIRTGFLTGLTLGQISEFSLIFVAMALANGIVGPEIAGLITLVALTTFVFSTYGVMYSGQIYTVLERKFSKHIKLPLPRRYEELLQQARTQKDYDVIVIGVGRYGLSIARQLKEHGFKILAVDFDPTAINNAQHLGITTIHGDASNPDLAENLPIASTKIIICALPRYSAGAWLPDIRLVLAEGLRSRGYSGKFVTTSQNPGKETHLMESGVDVLLAPFLDAAAHATGQILGLLESGGTAKAK
jgi:Kef-type K+ transport system membrane component KefB